MPWTGYTPVAIWGRKSCGPLAQGKDRVSCARRRPLLPGLAQESESLGCQECPRSKLSSSDAKYWCCTARLAGCSGSFENRWHTEIRKAAFAAATAQNSPAGLVAPQASPRIYDPKQTVASH